MDNIIGINLNERLEKQLNFKEQGDNGKRIEQCKIWKEKV